METINLAGLVEICRTFGPVGLIALIWYCDMRAIRKIHADHKEDVGKILTAYKDDMTETRRMYEDNVRLVEQYESVAKDLKDLVVLNTQAVTRLSDDVNQNQYCPMQRVEKKRVIQEAG